MDWQQALTLGIVALTATLFARRLLSRKSSLTPKSPCGCSSPSADEPRKPSLVFKARKGERPRIIVRN